MGEIKIFVGNLSWGTTDDSLRSNFEHFGEVVDCIILKDRETGRSRGFGFVTFGNREDADAAISGMNDQDVDGRNIRVNLANERGSGGNEGNYRGSSGGYGGRGRGGYGGNSGRYGNSYNGGGSYGNRRSYGRSGDSRESEN